MKRPAEHSVALSSYRLKWLWWISKVLVEAQREPNPSPVSIFSLAQMLHSHWTPSSPSLHIPLDNPLLPLISSFHKSPFAIVSLHALLFPHLHFVTEARSVLIISVELRFTFLEPVFPSVLPVFQQSECKPLLHLLHSYLLILPSVSIMADCCHFRPVCPCISFLFLPSYQHRVPSVFLDPSLSWQTERRCCTDTSVGSTSVLGIYTIKIICLVPINKNTLEPELLNKVRLENTPHMIYCKQINYL